MKKTFIAVEKDVAANVAAANIVFDGVTLKGEVANSPGVYFQFAAE